MPHEHFDKERPPIIIASQYGHEEIVKLLLDNGANPNIQTKNGDTALIVRRGWGDSRLLKCSLNLELIHN